MPQADTPNGVSFTHFVILFWDAKILVRVYGNLQRNLFFVDTRKKSMENVSCQTQILKSWIWRIIIFGSYDTSVCDNIQRRGIVQLFIKLCQATKKCYRKTQILVHRCIITLQTKISSSGFFLPLVTFNPRSMLSFRPKVLSTFSFSLFQSVCLISNCLEKF
jgi:hypothetical protein